MTLLNLDKYINNYIHILKLKKSIRHINNIGHKISRSKKSLSLYIYFYYQVGDKIYRRSIRISDHYTNQKFTQSKHFKGIIIPRNEPISSKNLRKIETSIQAQIKRLIYAAPRHAIYEFTA